MFHYFWPKLISYHVVCQPYTHFGVIIYVIYLILWFIYVGYCVNYLSHKNNFCPIAKTDIAKTDIDKTDIAKTGFAKTQLLNSDD